MQHHSYLIMLVKLTTQKQQLQYTESWILSRDQEGDAYIFRTFSFWPSLKEIFWLFIQGQLVNRSELATTGTCLLWLMADVCIKCGTSRKFRSVSKFILPKKIRNVARVSKKMISFTHPPHHQYLFTREESEGCWLSLGTTHWYSHNIDIFGRHNWGSIFTQDMSARAGVMPAKHFHIDPHKLFYKSTHFGLQLHSFSKLTFPLYILSKAEIAVNFFLFAAVNLIQTNCCVLIRICQFTVHFGIN